MLKDVDQVASCALVCQNGAQCPSGAKCQQVAQMNVGVCLFPESSSDWFRSSTAKKFAVGWPQRAGGGGLQSAQIAKGVAALQSLKSKYIIGDGDTDIVVLKEFLASLQPGAGGGSIIPFNSPAPFTMNSAGSHTGVLTLNSPPSPTSGSIGSQSGRPSGWDFSSSRFSNDANYFANNMMSGLPGIGREIHDTVWNVEHINQRGVASEMLRGVIMLGFAYLGIGCLIKSQMHGAQGMDMIPHVGFWSEYPQLVCDGLTYLQILAGGSPKGGGNHSDLTGGIKGRGLSTRGGVGSFDAL
jgi:hypothetical protein